MIFFNVEEARNFLVKNGFVYTLRRHRKHLGSNLAVYGGYYKWEKLGACNIEFIKDVSWMGDLTAEDVENSGFETVTDWWKVAMKFYQGSAFSLALYKVILV